MLQQDAAGLCSSEISPTYHVKVHSVTSRRVGGFVPVPGDVTEVILGSFTAPPATHLLWHCGAARKEEPPQK